MQHTRTYLMRVKSKWLNESLEKFKVPCHFGDRLSASLHSRTCRTIKDEDQGDRKFEVMAQFVHHSLNLSILTRLYVWVSSKCLVKSDLNLSIHILPPGVNFVRVSWYHSEKNDTYTTSTPRTRLQQPGRIFSFFKNPSLTARLSREHFSAARDKHCCGC